MKSLRAAVTALATAALAAMLLASTAIAAAPVPQSETLDLSSPKLTFTGKLSYGAWYVVDVTGTGSFVKPSMWTHPVLRHHRPGVVCGTPEPSPLFPTAGPTGPVGFDAETMFARTTSAKRCLADPLPRTTRRFQLDNGSGFRHPTTLQGRYTVPRVDHAYSYPIRGLHKNLKLRVRDHPIHDNYGALQLTLRLAEDADCAARQWRTFVNSAGTPVFADQAGCEAAL